MNVLASILKNNDTIITVQKAQTDVLSKMYGVQVDLLNEQREENKRAEKDRQLAKRKKADRGTKKKNPLDELVGKLKPKDKKKGILGKIMDALPGLIGGAAILKGLGVALIGAVGAGMTAYFASPEFREMVNTFASDLFNNIKKVYTKAVVMGGGKIADTGGDLINKALYGTETSDRTKNLQNARGQAQAEYAIAQSPGSGVEAEEIKRLGEKVSRMQDLVKASVNIEKSEAAIKRLEALREETYLDIDGTRKSMAGPEVDANIKKEKKRLEEFKKTIAELTNPELYQSGGFVGRVPNQGGNGDRFPAMLQAGSVVLNQRASGFQSGGMVPTMLEQGERVFGPRDPMAGAALMLNSMIPRFQNGGLVPDPTSKGRDENDGKQGTAGQGTLDKLDFAKGARRAHAPVGMCVTGSLDTMQYNGVPNPAATGNDVGNNPRGGAAQLINSFGWGAMAGSGITLDSPYGAAPSKVLSANQYQTMVSEGKIPSGALVFQTRHSSWNGTSPGSRGYDMAIAQDNGGYLWNGVNAGRMVYGNTNQVMVLTPGGTQIDGEPPTGLSGRERGTNTPMQGFGKAVAGVPVLGFATELLGKLSKSFGRIFQAAGEKEGGGLGKAISGLGGIFGGFGSMLGAPDAPTGTEGAKPGVNPGVNPGGKSVSGNSLLDFIAKGEGGYNSMNQGTSGGSIVGSTHNASTILGKNLPEMTIGEVVQAQQAGNLFAAGRYQIIPSTMTEALKYTGLSHDDMFNEENQDKLGLSLITGKRPKVGAYISGKSDDLYGAHLELAKEFASIPDPNTGNSFYGNGNKALHTNAETKAALMNARKENSGMQTGGVAQVQGKAGQSSKMAKKSLESFLSDVAGNNKPVVIPMPMGGGGGGSTEIMSGAGPGPKFPSLPAQDHSVVSMEYKYRITMGASV